MRSTVSCLIVVLSGCGPTPADGNEDEGTGPTSAATDVDVSTASSSSTSTSSSTTTTSTSTSTSTSGTTGFDTSETGYLPDFQCDPIDQQHACTTTLPHCIPFDGLSEGGWSGTRCTADGNDEHGVGSPCSIPDGPLTGQRDCAKGLACAAADVDATDGVCVRLCWSLNPNPCAPGQCYPCSLEHFPDTENPIGVCLDDLDCPNDPACAVAGCWPVFP